MRLEVDDDGLEAIASGGDSFLLPATNGEDRLPSQLERSAAATREILRAIPHENPDREGLKETPHRHARAVAELTIGYAMTVDAEVGEAIFGEASEGVIAQTNIPVYSLCEHHLLPFFGAAHIAYFPDPTVGIIGLSKLTRIVEVFARRLQVQERLTKEIADSLERLLKPRGVAVILTCRHMCMEMRGVRCNGTETTTIQKLGVFQEESGLFDEFLSLVNASKVIKQAVPVTASSECSKLEEITEDPHEHLSGERAHLVDEVGEWKDCDNYRLYLECAQDEPSSIAKAVEEAVIGPLSQRKEQGLSILDIGAGNGIVLRALCDVRRSIKIAHYAAYEMDASLCAELCSVATGLGLEDRSNIIQSQFNLQNSHKDVGGTADVVLLSHCLYGLISSEQVDLVQRALQCVAPGGILMIVHRWEPNGTLDRLSKCFTEQSLLHIVKIWESHLCTLHLDAVQRMRLNRYTDGDVSLNDQQTSVVRLIGCIAVEPHSCSLNNTETASACFNEARRQVGYLARKKTPSAVVKPSTVVGIQACLRAAALQSVLSSGSGKVTVIGGGHSENAFADNAIAINMALWNQVEVDTVKRLVKIGGGATSGEVTEQCEKNDLVVPLGDRPGVGAGLILLGGLNHFMRRHGLATDNIVRVVYVNTNGEIQEASTKEELFPFRGAGSNFGVVLEITVRAFPLDSIAAQDIVYDLPSSSYAQLLRSYSKEAMCLLDTGCLDGFLFWSGSDQLSFATSHFDIGLNQEDCLVQGFQGNAKVGAWSTHSPTQLFDRELYMTDAFAPHRVLRPNENLPTKLRSNKRCLFLPSLTEKHESILSRCMKETPTKWCYIHLLHGGGAVARVGPLETAFGCRQWVFAAVVTARWPDGDEDMEKKATEWLAWSTDLLIPYSEGVYGSDLGPRDKTLARRAFGLNHFRLARMKQTADPLHVLGCACPIAAVDDDPRVQARGIVLIVCGPRCSGKDWLASNVYATLRSVMGETENDMVSVCSISDETKREFAEVHSGVDLNELLTNRRYKESHRKSLSAFYERKKAQSIAYDAECYVKTVQGSDDGRILLLTGMRDGLDYARRLAGKPVLLIKVTSSNEAKEARGWTYDKTIDESHGELAADAKDDDFWDLVFDNGLNSTCRSAATWTRDILVPSLFQRCVRTVQQPSVQYRDIVGSLLLQPFAMALWTGSVVEWVEKNGQTSSVDAIVSPESLGFVFAGTVASFLKKPLILLRKGGKLVGDKDSVSYDGSNIHNLIQGEECEAADSHPSNPEYCLEIVSGSVLPGQRILVVDDCLASGATVRAVMDLVGRQGGVVTKLAVLTELPDLQGRPDHIDIFSVTTFPGS